MATSRRELLGGGSWLAMTAGLAVPAEASEPAKRTSGTASTARRRPGRLEEAYRLRREAADRLRGAVLPVQPRNDDEALPGRIGSFTRGLPHNEVGEVDPAAYEALLLALADGSQKAFEAVPLAGTQKLVNPQAAYAFEMAGADPWQHVMKPAPSFSSAEQAAEAVELYWHAVTRDVPLSELADNAFAHGAAAEMTRMKGFTGPRAGGAVTPQTLFRGNTPGDLLGPYVSQFLLMDIPYGSVRLEQKFRTVLPGTDYLTSLAEWLQTQNGKLVLKTKPWDQTNRVIRTGRDLAEWVQRDFSYQAFLDAALILLGMNAPLDYASPYRESLTQMGFAAYGAPAILDLVARAANCALNASWYQKWLVHRRARPEEYCGRVHHHRSGARKYPLHSDLVEAGVLDAVYGRTRSYLLPQAYPEAAPLHPSYPAGHAAIAGACVTVLKAFFDEAWVIRNPVTSSGDCATLHRYLGTEELTVGGELNKLASNVAIGRNWAGIHWRSDGIEGMKLGEEVAIGLLRDAKTCTKELFEGFSLTRFDGTSVVV